MIYVRLGIIAIVILVGWIVTKLLRSPWYDKLCDDLAKGNLDNTPETKETMKDITDAEKDLGEQSRKNRTEAEKLKKESKGINNFLSRGAAKTKKGEES